MRAVHGVPELEGACGRGLGGPDVLVVNSARGVGQVGTT